MVGYMSLLAIQLIIFSQLPIIEPKSDQYSAKLDAFNTVLGLPKKLSIISIISYMQFLM